MASRPENFIDIPSLILIFGGILCGTFGSFPLQVVGQAFLDALRSTPIENEERALQGYTVFAKMADFSVISGLLGTVIGLISMLANLDDPTTIGPAMAVALLTMFYGIVLGEFVLRTLANSCLTQKNTLAERHHRRGISSVYFSAISLFLLMATFFVMLLAAAHF